jgi:DNA-binding response OmpR family regulator
VLFLDGERETTIKLLGVDHDALVIVVSEGNDVHHEVGCLECGADDSLRQPCFPAQLVARMRAGSPRGRSTLPQPPSSLIIPVDALHQEVRVSGQTVRLTPIESHRRQALAAKTNAVCRSEHLVSRIWGWNTAGESRLTTALICHLRRKVERDPGNPPLPPPRCRRGLHVGLSASG